MQRPIRIYSHRYPKLFTDAIPGHFATNHSHINYFIDMSQIKHNFTMCMESAHALATHFSCTSVDTILCVEDTGFIGAFLARELSATGIARMNDRKEIFLVEPESNINGQFVFADNLRHTIEHRNVLVLASSASTGQTLEQLRECVEYYGGRISGYAAIFSNLTASGGIPVVSLFAGEDFPHYQTYRQTKGGCPLCAEGQKLDAIVTAGGYKLL